jgi:hypothetical protein
MTLQLPTHQSDSMAIYLLLLILYAAAVQIPHCILLFLLLSNLQIPMEVKHLNALINLISVPKEGKHQSQEAYY